MALLLKLFGPESDGELALYAIDTALAGLVWFPSTGRPIPKALLTLLSLSGRVSPELG